MKKRYSPPNPSLWKGRSDSRRFHNNVEFFDINHPQKSSFGILGFASDEGIRRNFGRPGAKEGPNAIRQALAKLPYNHPSRICDYGDISCDDGDLESAQKALGEAVAILHESGIRPIILGGGHEVSWGHFQGIPNKECAIINFDAHYDIRPIEENGSSGTPFLQIAKSIRSKFNYTCIGVQKTGNTKELFEKAEQMSIKTIYAEEIHLKGLSLEIPSEEIYLSICLDVFAAPFAPGVSAPQTLGLFPWQVIPVIRSLAESGKVISLDIAEMSPPFDRDGMTANLAATLITEYIHHTEEG